MTEASRWQRIWRYRPLLLYAFIVLVMVGILYSLIANARVSQYSESVARDPETGIMKGCAPEDLGPENAARAVLFVHGFIGCPSNFGRLPEQVADAGWRARVMLLPGHGTTPRDLETTPAEELLTAVKNELDRLRAEHETVVLMGHSMGGALATLVAAETGVDGLILGAPYYGLLETRTRDEMLHYVTRVMSTAIRWVPGRPDRPPVNKKENWDKIASYGWVPTQGALTAMELCDRVYEERAYAELEMPLLLIHSRADEVTAPEAAERIFERIPGGNKKAVWLEKSNHVYFWDYESEEVAEAVWAFLERWPSREKGAGEAA